MQQATQLTPTQERITDTLAQELNINKNQIIATVALIDDGATIPFIARYRKEVTGGLDDNVLRQLEIRLAYLKELEDRRSAILQSIQDQDKLSPELEQQINLATSKQRLEDLYAPFKPKRRTRAQIAREAGLEELVQTIAESANIIPIQAAEKFINTELGFTDAKAALNGARDILTEDFSENADLIAHLREFIWQNGFLYSSVIEGQEEAGANFKDWFEFKELLRTIPSHRMLAMLRGRQQGVLDIKLGLSPELEEETPHPCVIKIADFLNLNASFKIDANDRQNWYAEVCRWAWRVRILNAFETEFIGKVRDDAESKAIQVFAENLKDLLLAAPAGPKAVLGLDPGIRTGVKVAAIDVTGKVVATDTIFPHQPRRDIAGSSKTIIELIKKHNIELIAIGNGTASRETDALVKEILKNNTELKATSIIVNEAGASVYSASELASKEFPDLDVSLRGAVSIARRLQDPLAELVKIEPKAIGVGQYQHDVNQRDLSKSLDVVIEDCVNAVGVDVNTASSALLSRVSGLTASVANNIVQWRNENGVFNQRKDFLKVPRFGPKAYEQAAGFLRIPNGKDPLDASAVHPEAYSVAKRILDKVAASADKIRSNPELLKNVSPKEFIDEKFGLPTVQDIFKELEKPGRDPRPEFKTAKFTEGINSISDLQTGMILEGVVTNVANFGAFVDLGVHQDGLVHISALSNKFIKDPRDVVRVGDTVKVKITEVDINRKRIALTMRLDDDHGNTSSGGAGNRSRSDRPKSDRSRNNSGRNKPQPMGAMAEALAKLKR